MKRKSLILICVALLVLPVQAQTRLTISECISMAKSNNKLLQAARHQQMASKYDKNAMLANFFPKISLEGIGIYDDVSFNYSTGSALLPVVDAAGSPMGTNAYFPGLDLDVRLGWIFSGGVLAQQPLYMGGKIITGYRMAKLGNEISRENVRLTESDIIIKTSQAFANVVKAYELQDVAQNYNALLEELYRSVVKAFEQGIKTKNDVLKVQVKLNESKLKLRQTENAVRLATMNLCHYIGLPLTEKPLVSQELPPTIQVENTSNIVNRPEYRMLEKKTELARQQIKLEWSERLPQVALLANFGYTNGLKLNGEKLIDGSSWLAGVKVSIPVFHFGHGRNKVLAARARYSQTQSEQADSNEMLQLQLTQSMNNLDEAELELQLANSSVDSAKESLRVSKRQYEAGLETLSDFLETQTLWRQAVQTQIEARVNRYMCFLEYQKASGSIN
ncbi:MAG: TolC family protein [Bacteroidales bacterium]|nr:TolC family protein [Bacteroidales bacterium]